MKRKSKHQIMRKKKEFRFHKIQTGKSRKEIRHPAYIFLQKGNLYIYVTLTHSSTIKGEVLIKLKQNPNPFDKRDSFWVAEIKSSIKSAFTKVEKNWKLSEEDDIEIRKFFDKEKR